MARPDEMNAVRRFMEETAKRESLRLAALGANQRLSECDGEIGNARKIIERCVSSDTPFRVYDLGGGKMVAASWSESGVTIGEVKPIKD